VSELRRDLFTDDHEAFRQLARDFEVIIAKSLGLQTPVTIPRRENFRQRGLATAGPTNLLCVH
jgi:hypothetical protein